MNKTIAFTLLVIVVIVSLASCRDDNIGTGSTDSKSGDTGEELSFEYFVLDLDEVLMKIDCKTGISTPLCQDPLCDHGNDCPYRAFGTNYLVTDSGDVYFVFVSPSTKQIRKHNMKTGELIRCYETKSVTSDIQGIIAYKDDLYFIESDTQTKEDGESRRYFDIFKLGLDNKVTKLNDEKLYGYLHFDGIKDDRIYFFNSDTWEKFSTTLEFTDREEIVDNEEFAPEDYLYDRDEETGFVILKSAEDDKGNRTLISDCVSLTFRIGDYIYYTQALDEPVTVFEDEASGFKLVKGIESRLYHSKYDGSDNGLLCDFGDNVRPFLLRRPHYVFITGDYCLIEFMSYKWDDRYKSYNLIYTHAVLNYKTGEYKMVT